MPSSPGMGGERTLGGGAGEGTGEGRSASSHLRLGSPSQVDFAAAKEREFLWCSECMRVQEIHRFSNTQLQKGKKKRKCKSCLQKNRSLGKPDEVQKQAGGNADAEPAVAGPAVAGPFVAGVEGGGWEGCGVRQCGITREAEEAGAEDAARREMAQPADPQRGPAARGGDGEDAWSAPEPREARDETGEEAEERALEAWRDDVSAYLLQEAGPVLASSITTKVPQPSSTPPTTLSAANSWQRSGTGLLNISSGYRTF